MSYTPAKPVKISDAQTAAPINDIVKKYAEDAGRIYTNRTAGDYTWEGLLVSFLREVEESLL